MRQDHQSLNKTAFEKAFQACLSGIDLDHPASSEVLATDVMQAFDKAGFEVVRKPTAAPPLYMVERTTQEEGFVIQQRLSVPVETEVEKAARWASVLIAQILEDGSARQAEAGVDAAGQDALVRLRWDRQRVAFEDIDRNPPGAAGHADHLIATWARSLGDAVEWCEARLLPRRLVLTVSLNTFGPDNEQVEDLDRRLDIIRSLRGVVGADRSDFSDFKVTVEVRFDHYITTVGCEYTPLDLPAKPRRAA